MLPLFRDDVDQARLPRCIEGPFSDLPMVASGITAFVPKWLNAISPPDLPVGQKQRTPDDRAESVGLGPVLDKVTLWFRRNGAALLTGEISHSGIVQSGGVP